MPVFRLVRSAVLVALRLAKASPTSEAVRALLDVKVKPFTLTDSPLAMAAKVRVDVDFVPGVVVDTPSVTVVTSAVPWLNTFVGVGPLPLDKTKLKAAPPFN